MHRTVLGMILGFAVCLAEAGTAKEGNETLLLDKIRTALGSQQLVQENSDWLWTGTTTEFGATESFRMQFDGEGRFFRETEGTMGTSSRYDGNRGTSVDWSGMPIPLELSTLEREQLEAWILTGTWLADSTLLELVETGDDPTSNETTYVLKPTGGTLQIRLVVDRETSLPSRFESNGPAGPVVHQLMNYQEFDGVRFPTQIERRIGEHIERVVKLDVAVRVETDRSRALYAMTPPRPKNSEFSAPFGEVPIRIAPTGHVLVQPRVDGELGSWFIFDTGAGNSGISTSSPSAESMEKIGTGIVASIFGTEENPIFQGRSLELGPIRLRTPKFFSMDLGPLTDVFAEPVGGIIGFDVLSRCVVELDLSEQRLTLHDPESFELKDGAWQELWLQDNHPIVKAEFDGHAGLFRLDVGAAGGPHGNVVFHEPTVRRLGLTDESSSETFQLGNQNVAQGTVQSLTLAGRTFEAMDVVFAVDKIGLFSDAHTAGNIGVGILQSFRIVLDYPHKRIALIEKP